MRRANLILIIRLNDTIIWQVAHLLASLNEIDDVDMFTYV